MNLSQSNSAVESASVRLRQHVRWLPADMETPIRLFLQLANHKEGVLLESAEVDGRWGRYSVLGTDIAFTLRCEAGRLVLESDDVRFDSLRTLSGTPFVEGLREVMRRIMIEADARFEMPPITRGLYGYFGYEMAGLFTPKLQKTLPPEQAECTLVLPGTIILFDHLYNRLCQITLGDECVHEEDSLATEDSAEFKDLLGQADADPESSTAMDAAVLETLRQKYTSGVVHIKEMLRQGEAIQSVLSTPSQIPFTADPFPLYRRMRRRNASPYMFFMRFRDITLFGSSPEVMVRCTNNQLQLSPIAGTRCRGKDDAEDALLAAELQADPKERAEHVMLVDLGRNDLGRIAQAGSVKLERLMEVERFSHVMHLTSRVTARLESGLDAVDVLAATFPAGTVSGAPKVRAMELIAETEETPRGPYAGCIGWLGLDKDAVHLDTGITIRSMWVRDGQLHWQAGAGIVFDSVPENEWNECQNKAAVMRGIMRKIDGEYDVPTHR